MFDLLSTAELTASCAIVVFVLSSILANSVRQRALVAAALAAWFCLVLAAGATGAFTNPAGIGPAGTGSSVVIPVIVLALLVLGTARGRELVRGAPMSALVGVHSVRVLGLSFVLLYAAKRLPAPFAPVAGWGDVAAGVFAIALLTRMTRRQAMPNRLLWLWNAFGLADLVVAVALGATSAPGPLQIFHGPPSSAIMTTLPWILIPSFLVPALIFLHLCTFYRLRTMSPAERTKNLSPLRVATQSS
jgi:hypothetical protein